MTRAHGPESLQTLQRLASEGATGELICAMDDAEVHVHLQDGRIAWATTSAARFAFARYVVQQCDIDTDALRELVAECRRERKPLGETLVEWGVASPNQVRSALQQQIVDALTSLAAGSAAKSVFLQRGAGYRSYNSAFTFPFDEVCAQTIARPASPARPRGGPKSTAPPPLGMRDRLAELVIQEPDVRWAEYHRKGAVEERAPEDRPPRGLHEVTGAVFEGDVDYVAIRGERESIIGFAHDDSDGSIWCGLDPRTVLGAALTSLRERTGSESLSRASLPGGALGAAVIGKDRGLAQDVLQELMARSKELWAVILVDDTAAHCLACRERFPKDEGAARLEVLGRLLRGVRDLSPGGDDGMSLAASSMVASSSFGWFFGSRLLDATSRDLWIVIDPGTSQGLGWAVLTALLRRTSLTSHELGR